MFDSVFNTIFSPILGLNPMLSIFLIGFFITLIVTLINKKAMSSDVAKKAKEKMESVRVQMLEAQKVGDTEKMNSYLKKLMKINSEYMRLMIKPMFVSLIISMLLVIIFFPWLNRVYSGKVIATVPNTLPIVGGKSVSWIWWYILCTLTISLILRKLLRM